MAARYCLVISLLTFGFSGLFVVSNAAVNIFSESKTALNLMKTKNYLEASKIWQKIISAEEEYSIGYNNLGLCQMKLSQYASALKSYKKANKISPNIDARAGIQWALLAEKNYDSSIEAGQKALKLDPENYWVHIRLATAYNAIGEYDKSQATYDKILAVHGTTADALLQISVANRQAGNGDAASHFLAKGYEKNSSHSGIRQALGLYPSVPNIALVPYYTGYQYADTKFKGKGSKVGGYATYAASDYFYFGAGYARGQTENLEGGDEYKTNQFSGHFTAYFDASNSLTVNSHYVTSNDGYTNKALVLVANYIRGRSKRFSLAAGGLFFPEHKGAQVSPSYLFNVWGPFWLEATLIGQVMGINGTEEQAVTLSGPPPPPGAPPPTQTVDVTNSEVYGAADASMSFVFSMFTIGAGGRLGSLYTPFILQGSAIFTDLQELKNGYYAFVRIYPIRWVQLNVVYAHDTFSNESGEQPKADAVSLTMTVRLP